LAATALGFSLSSYLYLTSLLHQRIFSPFSLVKMASATGIPETHPATIEARDDEPLLGRPGDVTQKPDENIYRNLFTGECERVFAYRFPLTCDLGTASVAQAGIWIVREGHKQLFADQN
jgi:hypothetical protein